MPTRHFVRITAAGVVDCDLEQEIEAGRSWDGIATPVSVTDPTKTWIAMTGHAQWGGLGSLSGWTRQGDGTFTAPAPSRVISTRDYMRLFTTAEELGFEALGEPLTTNGRAVRVLMRRLSAGSTVDLDHEDVSAGLALLKPLGVAAGIWPDSATADTRIAAILANQRPE